MKVESVWKEEFRNSIKNSRELNRFFEGNEDDFKQSKSYPLFLPKAYAKKIKNIKGPLGKQFLPNKIEDEEEEQNIGSTDPIGDQEFQKVPQLIHRYKNRALFTPTTNCPIICRYCFRKNELNQKLPLFKPKFDEVIKYLRQHEEIEEIIFTGGDPLILGDNQIQEYLEKFGELKSIKYIRFHTRTPIILPARITKNFCSIIKKARKHFKKVSIALHSNHREEIDHEVEEAILKLKETKATLLSQTVLLKGVNDNVDTLKKLFLKLAELDVQPYYMHHPDLVKGAMHFYLPIEEGRKIYAKLRNILPGWAIPQYVVDIPGGEGKTSAFNPEKYEFSGQLINKQGKPINYLTE